jgi:hypothetical protein
MDAAAKTQLEQAAIAAAHGWHSVSSGDSNTIDLLHIARQIEFARQVKLPASFPTKANGVAIVELVEQHFVANTLIRDVAPAMLAVRAVTLVDAITVAGLHPGGSEPTFVTALYVWHGCILMAKLLRPTHNVPGGGQAAYTPQMRTGGYESLRDCWTHEETRSNRWVHYGVTLARLLELNRKGPEFKLKVIEDWVPEDSPYWQ